MLPHGTFASLRKLRETVCSGKRETGTDFPALLGQILAENVSFTSSARISFCLVGKMGGINVVTPL
jgi:hypothetical protein